MQILVVMIIAGFVGALIERIRSTRHYQPIIKGLEDKIAVLTNELEQEKTSAYIRSEYAGRC